MIITDNGTLELGSADAPNSLFGLAALATRKGVIPKIPFVEIAWTKRHARTVEGFTHSSWIATLADFVERNRGPAQAEIDELMAYKARDPKGYAQAVVLFALLSPNVDFSENVYVARQTRANLDRIKSIADVPPLLIAPRWGDGRKAPINYHVNKAQAVWRALPFILAVDEASMTLDNLRELWGVGPKVANFATALWEPTADVFTLDSWMARLTHALKGYETRMKPSFDWAGYRVTADEWKGWASSALPHLSLFTVQWTLWSGTRGYHTSHLDFIRSTT